MIPGIFITVVLAMMQSARLETVLTNARAQKSMDLFTTLAS